MVVSIWTRLARAADCAGSAVRWHSAPRSPYQITATLVNQTPQTAEIPWSLRDRERERPGRNHVSLLSRSLFALCHFQGEHSNARRSGNRRRLIYSVAVDNLTTPGSFDTLLPIGNTDCDAKLLSGNVAFNYQWHYGDQMV